MKRGVGMQPHSPGPIGPRDPIPWGHISVKGEEACSPPPLGPIDPRAPNPGAYRPIPPKTVQQAKEPAEGTQQGGGRGSVPCRQRKGGSATQLAQTTRRSVGAPRPEQPHSHRRARAQAKEKEPSGPSPQGTGQSSSPRRPTQQKHLTKSHRRPGGWWWKVAQQPQTGRKGPGKEAGVR